MGKIDDLISPPMEVTFRDEKYTIDVFTLVDTPAIQLAFGNNDPAIKAEGVGKLLKTIARRLFPGEPESKIEKIDAKYSTDLLDVFFQLDNSTPEDIENIKKILSKRK